jgi:hypothetical protein
MTSLHHVSELVAINGTKSRPKSQPKLRPESGPSWDHVGTKSDPSREQVLFQPPTQFAIQSHRIFLPNYYTRFVTDQVGEHVSKQVHATNHIGHRAFAAEVKSTAKVITYPGASKI